MNGNLLRRGVEYTVEPDTGRRITVSYNAVFNHYRVEVSGGTGTMNLRGGIESVRRHGDRMGEKSWCRANIGQMVRKGCTVKATGPNGASVEVRWNGANYIVHTCCPHRKVGQQRKETSIKAVRKTIYQITTDNE